MNYYVNKRAQANGEHEVHKEHCLVFLSDRTYLGDHATCADAVREAKKIYPTSNACAACSRECHTGRRYDQTFQQ